MKSRASLFVVTLFLLCAFYRAVPLLFGMYVAYVTFCRRKSSETNACRSKIRALPRSCRGAEPQRLEKK